MHKRGRGAGGGRSSGTVKLRRRTLLIIGTLLALSLAIYYFTAYAVTMSAFDQDERLDATENVQRILNFLNNDVGRLDGTATDWAEWDDAYAFAQDHNPDFVATNLAPASTYTNNRLSLVLLADPQGTIMFAQ